MITPFELNSSSRSFLLSSFKINTVACLSDVVIRPTFFSSSTLGTPPNTTVSASFWTTSDRVSRRVTFLRENSACASTPRFFVRYLARSILFSLHDGTNSFSSLRTIQTTTILFRSNNRTPNCSKIQRSAPRSVANSFAPQTTGPR